MELLNKPIVTLNHNSDDMIFNLSLSNDLPEDMINNDLLTILNDYKNMIDDVNNIRIWDFCKKLSNEYELLHHCIKHKNTNLGIANYDPISRSFFKMWEICHDCNIIDLNKENIVYGALAEGPGGFIECFNFYRRRFSKAQPKDIINCITLKPYNNDIPGWTKSQRIFRECNEYNISFGLDDTGDLYNIDNIKHFAEEFTKKADLVSADGGFDFSSDYSNQEISAFRLIFCEIVTGLSILNVDGHMIVKIFDLYNDATVDLLYMLTRYFDKIHIIKPFTSRSANSEKYIVCKNFKGISTEKLKNLYELVEELSIVNQQNKFVKRILSNDIPEDFLKIIKSINIYFTSKQISSLIKGICYVKEKLNNEDINEIKQQQTIYSLSWCKKYNFPINYRCRHLKENNMYNYIPNF